MLFMQIAVCMSLSKNMAVGNDVPVDVWFVSNDVNKFLDDIQWATTACMKEVSGHFIPPVLSQIDVPFWCCASSASINTLFKCNQYAGIECVKFNRKQSLCESHYLTGKVYVLTWHVHAQLPGEVESFYDDLDEIFPWLALHSRVSEKTVWQYILHSEIHWRSWYTAWIH